MKCHLKPKEREKIMKWLKYNSPDQTTFKEDVYAKFDKESFNLNAHTILRQKWELAQANKSISSFVIYIINTLAQHY